MIHRYLYDGREVTIQFLMIDTLIQKLDGSAAWAIVTPNESMRPIQSWDILSIKPLMFKPE